MIFLHSSFRTSSTWLWSRFRRLDRVVAYNEIFNEQLATISRREAVTHGPGAWHSKHPQGAAYFLEFLPFIGPAGGAAGYDPAMALDRFIPADGLGGAISPAEHAYVAALIAGAERLGRVPVLSCTRTLGRLGGLQRAFPGLHVLLYRNIFHQWCSYCEQLDRGNPYFFGTLRTTIAANGHDDTLRLLGELLPLGEPALDSTSYLLAFVLLHLYLYAGSVAEADLVIDAGRLGREPDYRRATEAAIAERTGLAVDLSDARASLGYSFVDTAAQPGLIETLRGLAAPILLGARSAAGRRFAAQALEEFVEEAGRYAFYAGALARRSAPSQDGRERLTERRDAAAERLPAPAAALPGAGASGPLPEDAAGPSVRRARPKGARRKRAVPRPD